MTKNFILRMIILIPVIFLVSFVMANSKAFQSDSGSYEKGNDRAHIDAAREISAFEGVLDAAVISYEGKGMAGICAEESCDKEEILLFAESVLKTAFGENEVYYVSVGDETAEKIIELSLYLDTDMDKEILEQRTRFLLQKNSEI